MNRFGMVSGALGLSLLSACVSYPMAPTVMAMPGSKKTFEQFQYDDNSCRQYALNQNGGMTASQNAANSGMQSAAVGTVVGAAAGALIGGHQGAAVGAGTGLLVGSIAGADAANQSGYLSQRRINQLYTQCMYAKGERVPVEGQLAPAVSEPRAPVHYPPPPPPGWYP